MKSKTNEYLSTKAKGLQILFPQKFHNHRKKGNIDMISIIEEAVIQRFLCEPELQICMWDHKGRGVEPQNSLLMLRNKEIGQFRERSWTYANTG